MDLRSATTDDQAAIRGLLLASRLPVDDLDTAAIDFIVTADANDIVGVVGLERFGEAGLLRSFVVRYDLRSHGLGAQMVEAVEAHAAGLGLQQLVLLTQTAAPFFAKRGYATIARDQAPHAVQTSAEFRSICPSSATCMIKPLE